MEKKQISFKMPADEVKELEHHLRSMGGTKSGVIRSLLYDWMAYRRAVAASGDKATVNGIKISL